MDHGQPPSQRRLPLPLPIAFALCVAPALFAAEAPAPAPVPEAFPASRYQSIWDHSPFELEAPPPTNVAPESPLSDEFALAGITKVKGKTVVTLLDKKAGTSFDLREDQPRNSVHLLGVTMNRDPLLTEVKLSKGALTGTVGYDKKSLTTPPKRPPQTLAAAANPGAPQPQQSVLNRSSAAPTHAVARRRILTPAIAPPQPPGTPTQAAIPIPNSAQPELPQPRTPPTPDGRRQVTIPQPMNPQ